MNAKKEFLEHTQNKDVKCVEIKIITGYDIETYQDTFVCGILKQGYSLEDYDLFLQSIDLTYDDGYGRQELLGIIWYKDGTFSERYEYDGSESWVYQKTPEIPEILQ